MKKLLFILLALPMLATAQGVVQVPTCRAGNAFTIKIPVRFPDSMSVQYAWYRNDTLIDDSHTLLLGEKTIAYTVPAGEAYGSAVYYFKYNLHDDYDGKWTRSPRYALSFQTVCPPAPGVVSFVVCNGSVSSGGTIGFAACNGSVSSGGTIGFAACNGSVSSGGTIGFAACNGSVSSGGIISFATAN